MLSTDLIVWHKMIGQLLDNQLESMWKESGKVARFRRYLYTCPLDYAK
jgi:hypothetical protein